MSGQPSTDRLADLGREAVPQGAASQALEPAGTFDFGDGLGYEHRIGDRSCDQGWCGDLGYPKACEVVGCEGLVHANFGDESYDGYWLYTKCDVCGESE